MEDAERFTRCWTQAQPTVAACIHAWVPDFHEAEDLLQDVAVVLLSKFGQYDPARPFAAWALGVAKKEVLVRRRSHARSFLLAHTDLVDRIAEACERLQPDLDDRMEPLRRCLAQVQGRSRQLLSLRYEEGLLPGAIAQRLKMTAGAVRTTLSRVRDVLQQCVERALTAGGRS
jgi:RNA polymerase sigma-70 factor, ECF subfamily